MNFFSLVSILISLAAVSIYLNYRYIKLPTTVGVMLVALVASLTLILAGSYAEGLREHAAALVSRIDFNQVVLHGMLAFLLLAGAIHVKLEELGREWLTISSLAIFGTLASTCIVGGVTWLVLGRLGLGIPIRWSDTTMSVDLTRQSVKDTPAYDAAAQLDREQEVNIFKHYAHPDYWEDELKG
jgi:Na+:H+ antiporter